MPGADISHYVWSAKYRHRDGECEERTIAETWRRVATALAAVEGENARACWAERFYGNLEDFKFLPGGRIQAGVGTERNVTLFNCFVMGLSKTRSPASSRRCRRRPSPCSRAAASAATSQPSGLRACGPRGSATSPPVPSRSCRCGTRCAQPSSPPAHAAAP